MALRYRPTLIAWFLTTSLVLLVVGVVAYRSITGLVRDTQWVTHTHEALETLNDTLALLTDAESSQRGYVVTHQAAYLAPYHAALPRIDENLRQLHRLTLDNPAQSKRVTELRERVRQRLETVRKVVAAREQNFEAAQRQILTDEGRLEMNAIRDLVRQMGEVERMLLVQRDQQAQRSAQRAILVSTGGIALSTLILLLMIGQIRREAQQRAVAELRLQSANDELQASLQLQQRLSREMTLLGAMADMLQSCRSLEEAYPVISKTLSELLPGTPGALCMLNASQNLMELVLEWNRAADRGASSTQGIFAPDECWAVRRGRPHRVENAQSGQFCRHLSSLPLGGYLCVPLAAQGEVLGLLYLENPVDAPQQDLSRVAQLVAEQLSLALANLKLQETLRTQSIRDPLTGLFNRRYLEASLERELARARRHAHAVAVIMMDVDHFKRFNDTFGHEAGDAVLSEFAGVLKGLSRGDDIACRFGGEEFTLILPETSREKACERAEQVRAQVKQLHIEHRRRALGSITVSLGVAVYPEHGAAVEDLVQAADAALYEAKQGGRDRVVLATAAKRAG